VTLALKLGHANPPLVGWIVAGLAAAAVLIVDAFDKHWRRGRSALRASL
jgi:hypothetical protein